MEKSRTLKIIGIDASTTCTGLALFEDGKLTEHLTINLKHVKESDVRIPMMMVGIADVLKRWDGHVLFVEDSWSAANVEITKMLSNVLGAVMYVCERTGCGFNKFRPSEWRKTIGLPLGKKKRAELKAEAIEYVKNTYGIEVGDDEAEAICIAEAASIVTDDGKIFE